MPIVGCALAMCDGEGCKTREIVPLMVGPGGKPAGSPPEGWTALPRSIFMQGAGAVELLCPACQKSKEADAETVRAAHNGVEHDPGTR